MGKYADEILMAYADGELEPEMRREIEAELARDPEAARAVRRHRALRAQLRAAFDAELDEPVPESLTRLVRGPAPVADLAAKRAQNAQRAARRWALPEWSAMAASVTLGLLLGFFFLRDPASPFASVDGALVARGELAGALDTQLAADAGPVRIGLSFRERGGTWCRSFVMQDGAAVAGLACREGGHWQLRVLSETEATGEIRTAASMPLAVLEAVDAAIDGEPLDAAAEAAARDAGWR